MGNARYTLHDTLRVAKWLRQYLIGERCEPKPCLGGRYIKLAYQLIGGKTLIDTFSKQSTWILGGTLDWSNNRLRACGICPERFIIIDRRRAAFAWDMLVNSDKHKFKLREHEMRLANNPDWTPDINQVLQFVQFYSPGKNRAERTLDNNAEQLRLPHKQQTVARLYDFLSELRK